MAQVETCDVCNGKGYVRCPICNGRGKANKETSGFGLNVFQVGGETVECPGCQAVGKLICSVCHGAGKIRTEKSDRGGFQIFP